MSTDLIWSKRPDKSYIARHIYTIILEPRPIDRYVAFVDGKAIYRGESHAGEKHLFWYLKDAQKHCQELSRGGSGFLSDTHKVSRTVTSAFPSDVPFPAKDQVVAAVRRVTGKDGRTWPIVDQAWVALTTSGVSPTVQTTKTLEKYVLEVAKWGKLRRWLTDADLRCAGQALWDIRHKVIALRGRDCFQNRISEEVLQVYEALLDRMRAHGMAKAQYSWASKLLHWLLPSCAPVYDSLVNEQLRITGSGSQAYRQIIAWEYDCAASLAPFTNEVLCGIREMTLLAAIDNYLWLSGKS